MANTKTPRAGKGRIDIVRGITTPLGFYVLSLLIVEATLAIVLTGSKLTEPHVWVGFILMIALFVLVLAIVTALTVSRPKNLLSARKSIQIPCLSLRR